MSLKGFVWKKRFFPVPAPVIQKQEPFITGANLERADWYLKLLKAEKIGSMKSGELICQ